MNRADVTAEDAARFWASADQAGDGACWIWNGASLGPGYGGFYLRGRNYYAHRFALMLTTGTWPARLCVLHSCDVRRCVNPHHLRAGTVAENNREARDRGRNIALRGDQSPRAVMTADDVMRIRTVYSAGMSWSDVEDVAAHLGVTPATVYCAATRRTWKHLP